MKKLFLSLLMFSGISNAACSHASVPYDFDSLTSASRHFLAANFKELQDKFNPCADSLGQLLPRFSGYSSSLEMNSKEHMILRLDKDSSNANARFVIESSAGDSLFRVSEDLKWRVFGAGTVTKITASDSIKGIVYTGSKYVSTDSILGNILNVDTVVANVIGAFKLRLDSIQVNKYARFGKTVIDSAITVAGAATISGNITSPLSIQTGVSGANSCYIADGDSRSSGVGAVFPYTTYMTFMDSTCIKNIATPGITMVTLEARANTYVDSNYTPGARSNIVGIIPSNNDFINHTASTTKVRELYVAYCKARKAKGFKVIAMTDISACQAGDHGVAVDYYRDSVNDYIRSNWPKFADALVDLGNHNQPFGYIGACNDPVFFNTDKLHPTELTYQLMAKLISAAVNDLNPKDYSIHPLQYGNGFAMQLDTVVTGNGTTFTSTMIGSTIHWPSGKSSIISSFTSGTILGVTTSDTEPNGSFSISYPGLTILADGRLNFGGGAEHQISPVQLRAGTNENLHLSDAFSTTGIVGGLLLQAVNNANTAPDPLVLYGSGISFMASVGVGTQANGLPLFAKVDTNSYLDLVDGNGYSGIKDGVELLAINKTQNALKPVILRGSYVSLLGSVRPVNYTPYIYTNAGNHSMSPGDTIRTIISSSKDTLTSNLPGASTCPGREYVYKVNDLTFTTGVISIHTTGGDPIYSGYATAALTTFDLPFTLGSRRLDGITIVSSGNAWYVTSTMIGN